MTQVSLSSRKDRAIAAAIGGGLHAAIIALVLLSATQVKPLPTPKPTAVLTVWTVQPRLLPAAKPPPPRLRSLVPDSVVEPLSFTTEIDVQALGDAPAAAACRTLEAIADSLLNDPIALAAVQQAPPETRSVAEAVVAYNAGWSSAAQTIDAPLGPVRANVVARLQLIEDRCLDEIVSGPRLITFPSPDGRTTIVVFGSGRWTWRNLLTTPPDVVPWPEPSLPAARVP
jgi:hypothetical protein